MPKIIKNDGFEVASEFNGKKTIKTRQSSEVVLEVLRARITQYLAGFLPLNLVQVYFHSANFTDRKKNAVLCFCGGRRFLMLSDKKQILSLIYSDFIPFFEKTISDFIPFYDKTISDFIPFRLTNTKKPSIISVIKSDSGGTLC